MSDLRILLVDDDDDDHLLTQQLVRRIAGHHLDRAATFEDGLARVLRQEHDVYLVDLRLGARSGLDLVREAVASGVRAPFIVLTGVGDHDIDVEAMRAGASDYVEKARATPDLLERSIRYALNEARSTRELEARGEKQAAVAVALEESVTSLRAIFDASLDAILIADDAGRYLDANPAACALLGLTREEVLRRSVADIVPGDQRARIVAMWPQFLRDGVARGTLSVHRAGDGMREVEFAATANFLPGRHLSVLRDVTERKLLEEQLRQAQKMDAVGRLAGGVAHDYNNVLTAIIGYGELISSKVREGDPIHRHAGEILKAGRRAAALTHQLLAFSRKQLLQPKVLNANVVVDGIVPMLRRLVGEDIDLTTKLARDLANTRADVGQLEQVLVNLVVNARDAMPMGGELTIETANGAGPLSINRGMFIDERSARRSGVVEIGPHVTISVTDRGCGMGEETLAHLFEPFFTTKELGKGTGLGLSTVYGIVKQSGGYISVETELGRGSTFRVYLPRVDARPEPIAPATVGLPKRGHEVILLVEDNDLVRTLATEILALHGYTVLTASNGGEALLICETHVGPIDLVLTDVVMPHLSGGELVERAQRRRPELRVLYMSGYTDDAIVHHGVLDGVAAFLHKPFLPGALCEKVREVLDAETHSLHPALSASP